MIAASNMTSQNSNRRIAIGLGALVLMMVGLSYASVPLYDLFAVLPAMVVQLRWLIPNQIRLLWAILLCTF